MRPITTNVMEYLGYGLGGFALGSGIGSLILHRESSVVGAPAEIALGLLLVIATWIITYHGYWD